MDRNHDIAQRIKDIANARVGKERVVRGGDIITEEIAAGEDGSTA